MRTCTAPTPRSQPGPGAAGRRRRRAGAFTLVELLVIVSFLALLVGMAQLNLFGVLSRNTFRAQVQDFISTMQMAGTNASESGRRYEMIIDFVEQHYLLRELTTSDLEAEPLVEQIITQGTFHGNCRVARVEYDTGDYRNESTAKFRVGPAGWQWGGKIIFLDERLQASYAVIVNRVTPIIQLLDGDPPLMTPKTKEQVPFL
ncbi:MAG: hypothetical protein MUC88_11360 [Planctomycetes bacterium]|jgi:Tfp pilus assembly protein FimT|nr:hypothetical protein [Planctomycetota bacterium]